MTRNKKNKSKIKVASKSTPEASHGSISEQNQQEQHLGDVGKQDKMVDIGDGNTKSSEANSDPITDNNQHSSDLNYQNEADLDTVMGKHKRNEQQKLQAHHDVKLEELKCEINSCILEEINLKERIKIIEDDKDNWVATYKSAEALIDRLDCTNITLQKKVIELEQSKDDLIQENQQLMKCVSSLEIRVHQLEEASSAKKITEVSNPPAELKYCNVNHESTILSEIQTVSEPSGNPVTTKHLSESHFCHAAVSSAENSMEIDPCVNHVSESSFVQSGTSDTQFLEENTNLDMLQLPLHEIKIEEIEREKAETAVKLGVPLREAPLIGAPFRMFSFVANYISGADLMNDKSSNSDG